MLYAVSTVRRGARAELAPDRGPCLSPAPTPVIVSGSRTAIGTFGGGLKDIPVTELGALVMKDALKRANLRPVPSEVMKASAPDKLKDQGITELEKKSYDWSDDVITSYSIHYTKLYDKVLLRLSTLPTKCAAYVEFCSLQEASG